jgi:hypothetical protein
LVAPAVPGAVRWPTTFTFEFTPTEEAPNGKNCGLTNWPAAVKLVAFWRTRSEFRALNAVSAASNSGTLVPSERSSACAAPDDVFAPEEWMVWIVSVSCAFAEPESHAAVPARRLASSNNGFELMIRPQ